MLCVLCVATVQKSPNETTEKFRFVRMQFSSLFHYHCSEWYQNSIWLIWRDSAKSGGQGQYLKLKLDAKPIMLRTAMGEVKSCIYFTYVTDWRREPICRHWCVTWSPCVCRRSRSWNCWTSTGSKLHAELAKYVRSCMKWSNSSFLTFQGHGVSKFDKMMKPFDEIDGILTNHLIICAAVCTIK